MYNSLSTYINKILLIVNLKYVDPSKMSIFNSSNNYELRFNLL